MQTHSRIGGMIIGVLLVSSEIGYAQPPAGGPPAPEQALANHNRMLENVHAHPDAKAQVLARLQSILAQRGETDVAARLAEIEKILDEAGFMPDADFEQNQAQLAERIAAQMRPAGSRPAAENSGSITPPAVPQSAANPAQWIDVHDHLIPGQGRDFAGAFDAALASMDQAGIRTVIVMPPPQNTVKYDCDAYSAGLRRHADRFACLGGGGSLNVLIQQTAKESKISASQRQQFSQQAEKLLSAGACGFGEIAVQHLSLHAADHPYECVAADHPLLLLLADLAARHNVPIDVHLDLVTNDIALPAWLADSPNNPKVLPANLAAFERLLDHNLKANICWAHAGSDNIGHWTAELSRTLLQKHPNLYMSLRLGPGHASENFPLTTAGQIKPEWLRLLEDFSDRFVNGGDNFIAAATFQGSGTAAKLSSRTPASRRLTPVFLNALPPDLAHRIAFDNAVALYHLKP